MPLKSLSYDTCIGLNPPRSRSYYVRSLIKRGRIYMNKKNQNVKGEEQGWVVTVKGFRGRGCGNREQVSGFSETKTA